MAGWSDDIASHSLPATLPSTAKTSTRFLSDYQDQEILRNDISSLHNVPHLVQVWKLLFLEHTSCIWCCMYCYESLISSKWIGNHGYETPLSSMIRGIIVSSWTILWPLFQCCPGLPQTYYLSLSFKPCYFFVKIWNNGLLKRGQYNCSNSLPHCASWLLKKLHWIESQTNCEPLIIFWPLRNTCTYFDRYI